MSIRWDVKINESANKKLEKLRAITAMEAAMTETMKKLRDTYAMEPTPKITGNLRRSNTYEVENRGGNITGRVKNSAPYWFYVNSGTSRMKKAPSHFLEKGIDKVKPSETIVKKFNERMRRT